MRSRRRRGRISYIVRAIVISDPSRSRRRRAWPSARSVLASRARAPGRAQPLLGSVSRTLSHPSSPSGPEQDSQGQSARIPFASRALRPALLSCSQTSNVRCLTRLPIVRPSIQSARPGLDARQNATISLDADSVPSHTLPFRHIASSHSPTWAIPSIFPRPSPIDAAAFFFVNVPNLPPGPFSRAIHPTYQFLRVSRKSSTLLLHTSLCPILLRARPEVVRTAAVTPALRPS